MTEQENDLDVEDVTLPVKRVTGGTLQERLSENAYENILPSRYLKKNSNGEPTEDQEELFSRVGKNVALAEVVFRADNYNEDVTVTPDDLAMGVDEEDKQELFSDSDEIELTEENVKFFSYDSVIEQLSSEFRQAVEEVAGNFIESMNYLKFMPNSPTLMNAGDEIQQLSACFVLSPDDDMEDIHEKARDAALTFQSGGGTGYAFHHLRPYGDQVGSTGGISSGPLTFMETFDQVCETIAQGGTRRGAQMGIMRVSHPDVIEFIHSKDKDVSLAHQLKLNDPDDFTHASFDAALEEARELIDEDGRVPKHLRNAVEGHLSNFNISVGITDDFMEAVKNDEEYTFTNPRTNEPHVATEQTVELYERHGLGEYVEEGEVLSVPAREIWEDIIEGAHENGEPGVIYLERANKKHSFDVDEHPDHRIHATNPCLSGDMEVAVAGEERDTIPIEELADKDESVLVYSIDENDNIVVKEATAFKTKNNAETVTVHTDGSLTLELTPDHEVRTNNRGWVEAQNLEEDDSLRIIKQWITGEIGGTDSSYKMIKSNDTLKSEHRIIARDELEESIEGKEIHHKNFDSLDNSPENLEIVTEKEHQEIHDISGEDNPIFILKERGEFEDYKSKNDFYNNEGENNPMYGSDRSESVEIQCEYCQDSFDVTPHLEEKRRFCSPECLSESRVETETFTCSVCDNVVITIPSVAERRDYCSRQCAGKEFNENLSEEGRKTLIKSMEGENNPMKNDSVKNMKVENTDYEQVGEEISETRREKIESGELEKVVENNGKVKCQLCGNEYKSITNTHLNSVHDMSVDEYKEQFPNSDIKGGKQVKIVENHKVTSIEVSDEQDVYDMNVPETHNFFAGKNIHEDNKTVLANVHNCGEQPLEEYEACNLGHINLSTLVDEDAPDWRNYDGSVDEFVEEAIDWDELDERIRVGTRFLDNVVTMSDFPIDEYEETVSEMRKIGLGVMGLAQMYVQLGLRYGSDPANDVAQEVMTHINHKSKEVSHELALERGVFDEWDNSKYADPVEYEDWFEHHTGQDAEEWADGGFPVRNHNTTTIAPTGTTSMVGNTTGGCEPIYNVAYYKNVSQDVQGDEMLVEFDDYFLRTLEANNIDIDAVKEEAKEQMKDNDKKDFDGVEGLSTVPDEIGELFITSDSLTAKEHASVQCALQDGVDSSISKTVNAPNDSTVEDAREVFEYIYDNGGKGVTYYRDGTRSKQVLTTREKNKDFADMDEEQAADELVEQIQETFGSLSEFVEHPAVEESMEENVERFVEDVESEVPTYAEKRDRPDVLRGVTQRIETGYGKLYVNINEDSDGRPFELFANIGNSGGFTASFTESLAKTISTALRSGVDPSEVANELQGIRSPKIAWDNGERIQSIPDAIGVALERYIENEFEEVDEEEATTEVIVDEDFESGGSSVSSESKEGDAVEEMIEDGELPECPDCGSMDLYYSEGCKTCQGCGWSECS